MRKAISSGNVAHAYLINGELRSGKEYVAKIFAQALLCEGDGDKPCGMCTSCKQMEAGDHPDVIFIKHEKPNTIGIDDVRRQIVEDVIKSPSKSKYKIYIMNEAEKMTAQAQNAILKTIEEPPAYAIFLLLTTSVEELLPTIISRCVTLSMRPVPDELLKNFLMKEMQVPDYKADISVAFARGNLGRAKTLVASEDFDKIKDEAIILLKYIDEMEMNDIVTAIKKISDYKLDINDYLDIIAIWYRDVLLFKATGDVNGLIFKDEIQYIKRVAKRASYEGIENVIDAIDRAKARLKANVSFDLTMELLILTIKDN